VVEWDGLENRCGARPHRGFESHPLRTMMVEFPTCTRKGYVSHKGTGVRIRRQAAAIGLVVAPPSPLKNSN
jgi:hypothetical protein